MGAPLRILLLRTSAVGAAFRDPAPPAVTAPLGILYLASSLSQALGDRIELELASLSTAVRSEDEVASFVHSREPDLVAISSSLLEEPLAAAVAAAARDLPRPATVVIGGPYPTCAPERALRVSGADYAVCGEGEHSFTALVTEILEGGDGAALPGVASLDERGCLQMGGAVERIDDVDAIPFPAWERIDIGTYSRLYNFNDLPLQRPPHVPLLTSRGCPFDCSFCHNVFGRRFRARSPENVVAEMELLHDRFGVNELHIVDDIFNAKPARAQHICELILDRGLDVALAFPNGLRADMLSRELIASLQRAGCYSMTFALESAAPRILKKMNKRLDPDHLADVARYASECGIITSCFVMFGYPGETAEELEMTVRWLRDSHIDFPRHSIVSPFPGTELAKHARAEGFEANDLEVARASFDRSNRGLSHMPAEELRQRVRRGIAEIMAEPRRQRRVNAILARWDARQRIYMGHKPGSSPRGRAPELD